MFAPILLAALTALGGGEVPKLASARAQLDHAKELKSAARGTRGAERVHALDRACEAYAAVVGYWPDSGPICAEAAFREGELHRGLGRPGEALGAFQTAVEKGVDTPYEARGWLEIGHLQRRQAHFEEALASYAKVMGLKGAALRYRNDSREWSGKVHLALQDWEEAAASFRAWAEHAEGPVEVVRAVDLEARAWVRAGEIGKARQRVGEVRGKYESLAEEPTKEAAALRKALERMKAPGAIAAAEAEEARKAEG